LPSIPGTLDSIVTINIKTDPMIADENIVGSYQFETSLFDRRVITGYHRLDLGQPVVGQYVNYRIDRKDKSITFSSLVPGAKYRITAWELSGGGNRRRSRSPAVVEVTTLTGEQSELIETGLYKQHTCRQHLERDACIVLPIPKLQFHL
jgi:hypothetical protein